MIDAVGVSLSGYALGDLLEDGGWVNADGYEGAALVMVSGTADLSMAFDDDSGE